MVGISQFIYDTMQKLQWIYPVSFLKQSVPMMMLPPLVTSWSLGVWQDYASYPYLLVILYNHLDKLVELIYVEPLQPLLYHFAVISVYTSIPSIWVVFDVKYYHRSQVYLQTLEFHPTLLQKWMFVIFKLILSHVWYLSNEYIILLASADNYSTVLSKPNYWSAYKINDSFSFLNTSYSRFCI